jgi:uncharacterized protein (DUF3084 family)
LDQQNAVLTQKLHEAQDELISAQEEVLKLKDDYRDLHTKIRLIADAAKEAWEKGYIVWADTPAGKEGRLFHSAWKKELSLEETPKKQGPADLAEYDAMVARYDALADAAAAAGDLEKAQALTLDMMREGRRMFAENPAMERASAWRDYRDDYKFRFGVELSDDETTAVDHGFLL